MTDVEAAWVAGLLEGEGCFSLRWLLSREHYPTFEVRCSMADEDVIRRLHTLTGIGRVSGPLVKRCQNSRGVEKPQWLWRVGRRDGLRELIERLRPYMGLRRGARIDEMLYLLDAYPSPQWRHGTRYGYEGHGCKCDACREAFNAHHRAQRQRRRKAAA